MKRKSILLICLLVVGLVLLGFSWHSAMYVGAPWFNERANEGWHMNNYIVIPGLVAYVACAFMPWFLGGLFAGAVVPAFFSKSFKNHKLLFGFFVAALGLTALGFNTFDFMLGCFYWTNMTDPAPVVLDLLFFSTVVNAWDFYFFCFLVPLWLSGFFIGFSIIAKFYKLKF